MAGLNTFEAIIVGSIGFSLGVLGIWGMRWLVRRHVLKAAHNEGQDLIEMAEMNADELFNDLKSMMTAESEEAHRRLEDQLQGKYDKIKQMEEALEELDDKLKYDRRGLQSQFDQKRHKLGKVEKRVREKQGKYDDKKNQRAKLSLELISALADKSGQSPEELVSELKKKLLDSSEIESSKFLQENEEQTYRESEKRAKRLISTALARFARPYCPERGATYVPLADERERDRVLGQDLKYLPLIEKTCGVDLIYDSGHNSVSISGFDPVRRELGRASLVRLKKEKRIDETSIPKVVARIKKELFRRIRNDGVKIAKELRLKGLSREVTDMMGALRYRYSFTQNQYFHCGEVGFLCGLLATELNVDIRSARRAGMLHDIGKAMDHSVEGGHAVIGADFIKKNGEEPEIVHAVRAHHYDEQPSTKLAHLVIAADAISGARPGARRSTANSYSQKMEDLRVVAESFDGVSDTHILSAGREVRVTVDGRKIDDWTALDLSKDIAKKIEEECNYPGQIKVTVVRETHAIEYAK